MDAVLDSFQSCGLRYRLMTPVGMTLPTVWAEIGSWNEALPDDGVGATNAA